MKNEKYFKEVLKRYDKKMKELKTAQNTSEVSHLERELMPLLTELQMALPRLGEDIFQTARDRRKEILEGK